MVLLVAGIALTALLLASYTTRYTWIECGSLALSMAALIGIVFLSTAKDCKARERYVWLANQLAPVLDRQMLEEITTAIRHVSTSLDGHGLRRAASPAAGRQAIQAASTAGWPEAKQEPKAKQGRRTTPSNPVSWLLDEASVQSPAGVDAGFRIGGINVSDQALKDVRGTLKPDSTRRRRDLTLDIEGHSLKDEAVVPPRARFSLASDLPKADRTDQSGGAILTFRYSYAGQQKTTILYLTPPMVARASSE